MSAKIIGTGSSLPAKIVSNDDLAKIMDTSDEWIYTRTGIHSRHIAIDESTTSLATEAAKRAIEAAGISPEQLGLIIVATVSWDTFYPCCGCEVQANIGAVNAAAFDVNVGCSGFVFGAQIVYNYMKNASVDYALVIGAEVLSKMMDWSDRSTCVLFGDGAGAAVFKRVDKGGILSITQGSDGSRGASLTCKNRPVNNAFVERVEPMDYTHMGGQDVFKFAVRTVPESIEKVLSEASLTADDIKYFILHQANIRIIEAVAKRMGVSMDKFPTNLENTANISAATIPILLDDVCKAGKLEEGDKIVIAGFGAGLTWGAAVIEW